MGTSALSVTTMVLRSAGSAAMIALTFALTACAPAEPGAASNVERVTLLSVTCGDICYLDVRRANGAVEQLMCTADPCLPWFEAQQLPPALAGATRAVRLGTAAQTDAAGTVMEPAFPAIVAFVP